jgi:cell division septum initiation protein DivIVA
MAIDPDIQPHLDALTDRIVRVEARATQAEQDLAIIEPSIAQLEQTVAALEQTPGTPGGIKNPAIIVAAANSPQAIKARADIVCTGTGDAAAINEAGVMEGEAERDADVSAGAVARTVAMSHIAAERDAERAARERAEAEARQLREAIRAHENLHRPDGPDGADGPIEMDGWPCCNDDRLLWAAAVAEAAEDRGQTDG